NDAENITYRVVPTLAQRQDGQGGRSKNPARKEWNTGEQSPRSVRTRRQPVPHRQGRIPFQVRRSVAITWRAGQRGIRTGP
ncbi:hypothetical protein, partial [Klebsiella pneumoniae]|uniref:hypothetical protein n=1 Tax=Klebsiella pneumoniae TaxID=573 RepID=UPI003CEC0B09